MPLLGNGSASGSLRRRTITAKTSATSAVALLCLLGMGVIVAVTSGDVARNLHELSAQNLPSRGAAAAVNNDVVAAHMRVFRYVSWASNSVSHTLLQSLRKDIGADFHRIDRDFNALSERPGVSSAETTDLAALRDKLDKYKRTAKDVLDVGSTDAAMATMMLGQTDDRYTSIEADIRKILIAMSDQSNSIVDDLASATSRETLSLTIGLLACLAFLIVGIIFIAKSIVRPITSITRAMQKLSSGDTDVKLGYHGRGDEIGRIIEAIEIFRRNALEIQAIQISRREADEERANKRHREMAALAGEFEGSVKEIAGQLVESVNTVRSNAQAMAKAADDTRLRSASAVRPHAQRAKQRRGLFAARQISVARTIIIAALRLHRAGTRPFTALANAS